jgi:hypothetical protein
MNSIDKSYVRTCGSEDKMFVFNGDKLESMTIQEYNDRHETAHLSWDDVNDDDLYSSEEVIEMYGDEDVKFV